MILGAIAIRFDVIVIGVLSGLGYAVLASGLVLVYRATKVINLAHGQIGAFSAAVLAVLVYSPGLPYPLALPGAVLVGAVLGALTERWLVRPLAARSRLAVLVATVGVTELLLLAQSRLPHVIGHRYPTPVKWTVHLGKLVLHGEHFALLIFGPIVLAVFTLFFTRSRYGLAIRGVAENPDAAQLAGISAHRVSILVWSLAGGLAAVAAILTVPLSGSTAGTALTVALGPGLLLRALAAGLAGKMTNLPATVGAGVAIGVVEAVLFASYPNDLGIVDLVLFVAIVGFLLIRGRMTSEPDGSLSFGEEPIPLPERIRNHRVVRWLRWGSAAALVLLALLLPLIYSTSSQLYLLARIPVYAIIGISIVVLTGWAGQLSLGQMAFVGVGAMGTAALASRGVPFGAAIGYSTIAGILLAVAVGAPALRLRGLFLTVTSLGFAVAASSYLLTRSLFRSADVNTATITPGRLGSINFNSFRVDYYFCVACLLVVILVARRLRASGIGRTLIAVEGNEQSAAAMTVSPAFAKLCAFGVAGGLATFAGGLLAGLSRTFQVDLFSADQSLQVLAMTVVGGVGTIGGAVLGAVYLIGVPNLLGNSLTVQLATSGIGLLFILRFEPSGLVGIFNRLRNHALRRFLGERDETDASVAVEAEPSSSKPRGLGVAASALSAAEDGRQDPSRDDDTRPALIARSVNVTIGGRVIVFGVDIEVGPGEIVGLIGSNGAGKSTLMNAICGFIRASGLVEIEGMRIDGLPPAERARRGLGRSFQSAALYPRLTVRESVQVALESQRRSELLPSLLALPPSIRDERWSKRTADHLLDLLGLGARAEQRTDMLSTGTRRVVEFACLLALRPRVVLLDEPMAGIAQREAEEFAPLLVDVRRELSAAMLVIEHDLPLITAISDRLYCLESGLVIAEGTPDAVRHDSRVIASYLGTDERAIARSAAAPSDTAVRRSRPLSATSPDPSGR